MRFYKIELQRLNIAQLLLNQVRVNISIELESIPLMDPGRHTVWYLRRRLFGEEHDLPALSARINVCAYVSEQLYGQLPLEMVIDEGNGVYNLTFELRYHSNKWDVDIRFHQSRSPNHHEPVGISHITNPDDIGHADEEDVVEDEMDVPIQVEAQPQVGRANAVVQVQAPVIDYLVLPGNYSGDAWASAACLQLDQNIKVAVPSKSSGIFDQVTTQFVNLCNNLEVQNRVLRQNNLNTLVQVSESQAAIQAAAIIREDAGQDVNPYVGWTYATTSVMMAYAEQHGVNDLLDQLCDNFVEVTDDFNQHFQRLQDMDDVVLVNMRIGRRGNHPQHDISEAIYAQIVTSAHRAGLDVVRIGSYQDEDNTPGGRWMEHLAEPVIELFQPGVRLNRGHTAHFWRRIAGMANVKGVIGGRSGSLDVASFMGVRTLCWDVVDVSDQEYGRQFLYYPIQSLCPRHPGGWPNYSQQIKNKQVSCPGILQQEVLESFLDGNHVIPNHSENQFPVDIMCKVPRLSELTGGGAPARRQRLMLRDLNYMGPYIEQPDDDELGE